MLAIGFRSDRSRDCGRHTVGARSGASCLDTVQRLAAVTLEIHEGNGGLCGRGRWRTSTAFKLSRESAGGSRRATSSAIGRDCTRCGHWRTFRRSVAEASFLFESDITTFIEEIDNHARRVWVVKEKDSITPLGDEKVRLADEWGKEMMWLTEQLPELKPKFAPYLFSIGS